jgi:hypothetical protein
MIVAPRGHVRTYDRLGGNQPSQLTFTTYFKLTFSVLRVYNINPLLIARCAIQVRMIQESLALGSISKISLFSSVVGTH